MIPCSGHEDCRTEGEDDRAPRTLFGDVFPALPTPQARKEMADDCLLSPKFVLLGCEENIEKRVNKIIITVYLECLFGLGGVPKASLDKVEFYKNFADSRSGKSGKCNDV